MRLERLESQSDSVTQRQSGYLDLVNTDPTTMCPSKGTTIETQKTKQENEGLALLMIDGDGNSVTTIIIMIISITIILLTLYKVKKFIHKCIPQSTQHTPTAPALQMSHINTAYPLQQLAPQSLQQQNPNPNYQQQYYVNNNQQHDHNLL